MGTSSHPYGQRCVSECLPTRHALNILVEPPTCAEDILATIFSQLSRDGWVPVDARPMSGAEAAQWRQRWMQGVDRAGRPTTGRASVHAEPWLLFVEELPHGHH